MNQLNKYSELYVDCSMAHGLDDDCGCGGQSNKKKDKNNNCIPCTYASTFGISATNQDTTIEYIAWRAAVFTHAIMKNRITHPTTPVLPFGATGESFFKDCENARECNQSSNPRTCNSLTLCDDRPLFPQTE